ncbi:MAG: AAA family ATPase [Prevotella sp.]|nr:AAA family ATPase [Prevotella sp.]
METISSSANSVRQLPLGISDFGRIIRENYYYVDKTMFIPRLEMASSYLFLVRPRRFGKSLLLSMLKCYYDINEKDRFDEYFGQLWIGSHPTPYCNRYAVLHLDFSQVTGTINELKANFDDYCGIKLDGFAQQYEHLFYDGFAKDMKQRDWATKKLNFLGDRAKFYHVPLYLIIDEYDNFTNTVLNQHGQDIYTGLTHGEGFYRDIFKLFKPNFERVLMLGVSPVTMDDLTSGYNIATNITADAAFNHMLGFSEDEVRQMFGYYSEAGLLKGDTDAMLQEMKPWYDNYCFAKDGLGESRVFNSNMVLYYLSNQLRSGHAPDEMADPNARTDYQKMKRLIQLDRLEPQRKSIIYKIAEEGYIYSRLVPYFPASEMVKFDNFVSLLYYYGMLTITGYNGLMLRLGIPNNNVRKQYYGYLLEEYDRIRPADHWRIDEGYQAAALTGDWQPLVKTISEEYEKTCAVRCLIEGERNLQGFFTAYLNMTNYYLTAPELELSHGYCDFFLLPDLGRYPMVAHSYILELKYLKQDATAEEAEAQWAEAVGQIARYAQDEKVRLLCGPTQLHLIVAQYRGYQLVRLEEVNLGNS